MPKTKISEFSATPGNNTDIDGINIAEGCAPSGINDAIRELMAQLKDFQAGTAGDSFNGPVGTSTAAAGAFTTLSSTGNTTLGDASGDTVTINGATTFVNVSPTITPGTANGVAYLNGSKVLTTGSALTFDGTSLSLTTAGATYKVPTAGGNLFDAGGNNGIYVQGTPSGLLGFYASGSEQMRLTSTGLGIGTSSPVGKLDVRGTSYVDTDYAYFRANNALQRLRIGTDGVNDIYLPGTAPLTISGQAGIAFSTDFNERMRLDSSGNLGIGTSSPSYKLDVQTSAGRFQVQNYGAGSVLLYSNGALAYNAATTRHEWQVAGSSLMQLEASGNLGLGVTPSAWRSGALSYDVARSSYADENGTLTITSNAYRATSNWLYKVSTFATRMDSDSGQFRWYTAPSGTAGNTISFTQAMTLDASGNLGVGTTSPFAGSITVARGAGVQASVEIAGNNTTAGSTSLSLIQATDSTTYIYNRANTAMVFGTNNTERARITSGGDLLVGKTATDGSVVGVQLLPSGASAFTRSGSTNATSTLDVYSTGAGAYRFYVGMDGTVNATNTTISAISDQRLKENIRDLDVGLNAIMTLKPRKFDWKEGKGKNIKGDRGWIAQEFEQVFPDMIDTWKDEAPEGEEPYKSVRADLIPVLVKAIQELKAEFDAYKATHP